jgi:D-amino-acid dehydrogenase
MRTDVVVLGAGIVGVCAALDLQWRGREVAIVDKRSRAGEETSFGNAGLIERASIFPYMFPRDLRALARYAVNAAPEAHYHLTALPHLAPWLWRYFRNSAPEPARRIAEAARPLVELSLAEHEVWAARAGVLDQIRRTGWIKLFRSDRLYEKGEAEALRLRTYGLTLDLLDRLELAVREPALRGKFAGAVHLRDPASVADPASLVRAYADLFIARGGRYLVGDARTLGVAGDRWTVDAHDGQVLARDVVVALGPWSGDFCRAIGYRLPLAVKRGYHVHFASRPDSLPIHPILDVEGGYVVSPMTAGVRMTTGAEFALQGARPTPVQVDRAEPLARALFDLGPRIEKMPWMGARPCLPDMLPVIGPAPGRRGLWFDFGHQHHGLTLGPVTARLLGEMMTGETPFVDPSPYRADRFRNGGKRGAIGRRRLRF